MTTIEFIATAITKFMHESYDALEKARQLYNFCQNDETLENYEKALDLYLQYSELMDDIMAEIKAEDDEMN